IKGKIDQRDTSRAFEYLEKLQRGSAFLIERDDFTIENNAFGRQQLQGADQLSVIERLIVARDQPHIIALLEGQCPITIVLDLIEPVALRHLLYREHLHRFNERWCLLDISLHDWSTTPATAEPNDRSLDDFASGHHHQELLAEKLYPSR